MKKFFWLALSLGAAFAFWACSQTVSGSDNDVGNASNIPGFGTASSASNGSSDSKGNAGNVDSGQNKGTGDLEDDLWDDWDEDFFSSSQNSGFNAAQYLPEEKIDCNFTVDDDEWKIDYQKADTTVNALFEFKPDGYMWTTISEETNMQNSNECEERLAMMDSFVALIEAAAQEQGRDDLKASAGCEGSVLTTHFEGRTEEPVTAADKQEVYGKICN